jgi:putative addiction module CopG family antidote
MSYAFPSDLQKLIDARLSAGHYASEDDVLRDALRALVEEDEDLQAVREAVSEWRNGDDGLPLKEAFAQIRQGRTA